MVKIKVNFQQLNSIFFNFNHIKSNFYNEKFIRHKKFDKQSQIMGLENNK